MIATVRYYLQGVEILRGASRIECWKCGRMVWKFGYPYGRYQEPNCVDCIHEVQEQAA